MTTKIRRAKQRAASWRNEYHNLRRLVQASQARLLKGCNACDYDEAEGGLVNHCNACCRRITTALYGILVNGDIPRRPTRCPGAKDQTNRVSMEGTANK